MNRTLPILLALALAPATVVAQWHDVTSTPQPGARRQAAMAFDLTAANTIVFGGMAVGGPFTILGDTWRHTGAGWTALSPATSPSARHGARLVSDLVRGRLVLYGGLAPTPFGGPSNGETWEWDGTNWTQVATAHSPGGRGSYGMAHDIALGRTVLYGGVPNNLLLGAAAGTWVYDGVDWAQVTTANSPGPLQDPGMCFHFAMARTVLFGGINPLVGATDNTWAFDGVNWTVLPIAGPRPATRSQAEFTYDNSRGVAVLFGGVTPTGTVLDDTWFFDGTSWAQQHGAKPPARRYHSLAFDAWQPNTALLMFGITTGGTVLADAWGFDGAVYNPYGAGCPGAGGVPVLSAAAGARLGQPFQSVLTGLLPSATLAAMATGYDRTSYLGNPLPLDLSPTGMFGCTLHMAPDTIDLIPAGGGSATFSATVPSTATLLGFPYYQQGASLEPLANPFGAVVSNAAAGVIGS